MRETILIILWIRILTFSLACIMSGAICVGVTVCIMAGIAYGYNYSLSEFLTFSRSDVTVYVRRGQFHDKGELPFSFRRSDASDADENVFPGQQMNSSNDYEDKSVLRANSKELSDTWKLAQDTRSYAEKLTKFGLEGKDIDRRQFGDSKQEDNIIEPDVKQLQTTTESDPYGAAVLNGAVASRASLPDYGQTQKRISEVVKRPSMGLAELIEKKGLVDVEEFVENDSRRSKKKHRHRHKHKKIIIPDTEEDYLDETPDFKPI